MKCNITRLFSSVEKLKERIHINMETLEVTDLKTQKILNQCIKINSINGIKSRTPYKRVYFRHNGKVSYLRLNRLVFYYVYGYLPKIIDHIDRNSLNNKIENLRELTNGQNIRNADKHRTANHKIPSSKYKGVSWNKKLKKWSAFFRIDGRKEHLGYFLNEDDAGQAVNDKIRELNLEEVSVLNDTPQERSRKNNLFDPLEEDVKHLKVLFENLDPIVDLK